MVYYSILICLLLYYLLKRFSERLSPYGKYLNRVHFLFLAIWVANNWLMPGGWHLAGAYTNQILFAAVMCTGIIAARFYVKSEQHSFQKNYFKLVRGFTIFFLIIGIVPIFSGYGAGFIKDIFNSEYTSYPTGQGYVFRTEKQGAGNCLDLHLCEQLGILEHDIPVCRAFESNYECFDPLVFGIVTANADEIAAEAKFRGFEDVYLVLEKKKKKLRYARYSDAYTYTEHELTFGYFFHHDSVTVTHIDVDEYEKRWMQLASKYGYLQPNKDNLNIFQMDSNLLELVRNVKDSDLIDTTADK